VVTQHYEDRGQLCRETNTGFDGEGRNRAEWCHTAHQSGQLRELRGGEDAGQQQYGTFAQ
jgi:hypothetical protein